MPKVDNVIAECWFRSLKCDNIYINEYQTPRALRIGIKQYIYEYNTKRPHQFFGYRTPYAVYYDKVAA